MTRSLAGGRQVGEAGCEVDGGAEHVGASLDDRTGGDTAGQLRHVIELVESAADGRGDLDGGAGRRNVEEHTVAERLDHPAVALDCLLHSVEQEVEDTDRRLVAMGVVQRREPGQVQERDRPVAGTVAHHTVSCARCWRNRSRSTWMWASSRR